MKKSNIYIDILKIGRDYIGKSISRDELKKLIEDKGYSLNDDKISTCFNYCIDENFHLSFTDKQYFTLKSEAFFQLLEHERLEEARIDSRKAYRLSFWAFVISIILLLIQIFIMLYK